MPVVFFTAAWFLGMWAASRLQIEVPVWLAAGGLGLAAGWGLRRTGRVGLVCAGFGLLALGGGRYTAGLPVIDAAHAAYYHDAGAVTLTGLVVAEPAVRDRSVNLRLAAEEIVLGDGTAVTVSGLVQVRTFRFPVIPYGSRLALTGVLEPPPEEGDFNYRAYLARQGIHSLMTLPQVMVLGEGQGSPVYQAIFALKGRAQTTIRQLFPDPQGALLTGILLGDDNGLPPELAEDFQLTGMTHIIAISGANIAILIAILVSLSEPVLRRQGAAVFAVSGIILYTVLVGADASVVRAAVMGVIFLVTRRGLGRSTFAYASLFVAGFLMTLVNPQTLWDVGFQLSFVATLSLMLYADPFSRWTQERLLRVMDRQRTRQVMNVLSEAVILTLAAQILTLPLMIGIFQQVSLVSLVANALILPVQPAVMIWGGLATLLGMVVPAVGQLAAWAAWLPLTYTIALVRLFAAVPLAAVTVQVSPPLIIGLYGLIAGITWLAGQENERRRRLLLLRQNLSQRAALSSAVVAALLVWSWGRSQPDGKLHIAFLNVGQGDATFIQTPTGRQILIDGGHFPTVLNDELGRQMPFWDRELDLVVATHPDADHVSGLVGVFERYKVGRLLTDGEGWGESAIYDAVLQVAEANGTPVLPGDQLLQALVFKAGHHGSRTSSTQSFLAAVQPRIIVVSAGVDNRFGHPHPEMLARAEERGTAVLRTDQLGTIELTTDGQTMWWQAGPN